MLKKVKKSEFARNVIILFSGSFLAQLIPFVILPILQKYFYSPADFGILAVFVSFCELFSAISCLKLEYGIVLQLRLKNALNLAFGALQVSGLMALVSFVLVLLLKKPIALYLDEPKLENLLLLLPLYIFLVALNDVFSFWYNRKKQFITISGSKIFQSGSAELIKLGTGFLNWSFVGLIAGKITGLFVSATYFILHFLRKERKTLKLLKLGKSRELILENKKYIFFTTPGVFISSVINLVFLNLFLYHFGKETLGMIGVSMTYISAGYVVISLSFSQVFYAKIAQIKSKHELLAVYKRFAKNLFVFTFIPLLVVHLIPVKLVVYLLGDAWKELIVIARIMSVWLSAWFVSSSLSFIFIRLGKQKLTLFYDLVHLLVIVGGFYSAYYISPTLISTLWGFTIAKTLFYVYVIYVAIRLIKNCDESSL